MQMADSALTPLFMEEFKWCKVGANESVAIVTESESRWQYAQAAQTALAAIGARRVPSDVAQYIGRADRDTTHPEGRRELGGAR